MPIIYDIHNDGNFIHAVAFGRVTKEDLIQYEVDHSSDPRINLPVVELLDVEPGAFRYLTKDDIEAVLEERNKADKHRNPHRCAIVVSIRDDQSWNIAKIYEEMVLLHYPENVIVFGDRKIAKTWLGL